MIDEYVLIDANDETVSWKTVTERIVYWKISVGGICPEFCDPVDASYEDVGLLLDRAKLIVSDRELYRELAAIKQVPFIIIRDDIERALEKVDGFWYAKAYTNHDNL